jgi:hypothetical protein
MSDASRCLPPDDDSRVDDRSCARDGLKDHGVAVDLRGEEDEVGVEAFRSDRARANQVAGAELSARSRDEVDDAVLGFRPLVDMIVSGEDNAHVVPDEKRREAIAQSERRAMSPRGRIQRMVEVGDLPLIR